MFYYLNQLSDNLVYIRWHQQLLEGYRPEADYIRHLSQLLDDCQQPVYFISDLREGRIINVATLQKLGRLTKHRHWAGSTAFSKNHISRIFVNVFSKFGDQQKTRGEMWNQPEEAIAYLETLKSGLTKNIDWNTVLGKESETNVQQRTTKTT